MAKITLDHLLASFLSVSKINSNLDKITAAFDNTLSRDGSGPNVMDADLDIGSNRIINVGSPVDDHDAVRLIDIEGLTSGGGGTVTWNGIIGKPTTFPPSMHTHVAADVTDFAEATQDQIGAHVKAGSNVTVTYDDSTGDTTIATSGALAADWNTLVNKPSTFTPATHTHAESDVTGLVADLASKAPTSHTHTVSQITDYTGMNAPNFVTVFSGVGDGTTSNNSALTAAIGSSYKYIWLPEGVYLHTLTTLQLADVRFIGPGQLKQSGGSTANHFRSINTYQGQNDDANNVYAEDKVNKFADVSFGVIQPNTRVKLAMQPAGTHPDANYGGNTVLLNKNYYSAAYAMDWKSFVVRSGASGRDAQIPLGVHAGNTSATLTSATGFTVGDVISFGYDQDGPWCEQVTITGISGDVITWTPALTYDYPLIAGSWPSGPTVAKGSRTQSTANMVILDAQAAGDHYAYGARVICEYQSPFPGQKHCFNRATGAIFGGDITLAGPGVYGTGTEITFVDTGTNTTAAVGDVRTFLRANSTFTYGVAWIGHLINTGGASPIDCAYSVGGSALRGLDLVRCDFSQNLSGVTGGNAAINLRTNHRIYFNSSSQTTADGLTYRGDSWYGNILGDSYITHGTDVGSDYLSIVKGAGQITLRPGALQINVTTAITGGLSVTGGTLTVGGNVSIGSYYRVAGTPVVGARLGSIPDTDLTTSTMAATINSMLGAMRSHGLITGSGNPS